MEQRERLRRDFATLLSVDAEDVTLSAGCTRGITDVALSMPLDAGQTLLSFQGEFPANIVPWQRVAELRGAELRLLSAVDPRQRHAAEQIVERVGEAIRAAGSKRRVRYLCVSAVQFQTGLAMPLQALGELCQKEGVFLLVDGIQGCGVLPYDLSGGTVAAFFTGAHKWLLGLEGAGAFVTSPAFRSCLKPLTAGWLSFEEAESFLFRGPGHLRYDRPLLESGRVFEGSTANAIGLAALAAGLSICLRLTPAAIFGHVSSFHDALCPQLEARGFRALRAADPSLRSCLLSFIPPDDIDVGQFSALLREQGVMVSIPDGLLRIAPHFSNSMDEISIVLDAVDFALRTLR
jgi:selenocysteine lyase/cysteine desulfurase